MNTNRFNSSHSFTTEDGVKVDVLGDSKSSQSFDDFDSRIFDDYEDNKDRKRMYNDKSLQQKIKGITALNAATETIRDTADYVDEKVIDILYNDRDEETRKEAEQRYTKRKSKRNKLLSVLVLVLSIIYLAVPFDLFPEGLFSIIGYIEDLAFMAFAVKQVVNAFN